MAGFRVSLPADVALRCVRRVQALGDSPKCDWNVFHAFVLATAVGFLFRRRAAPVASRISRFTPVQLRCHGCVGCGADDTSGGRDACGKLLRSNAAGSNGRSRGHSVRRWAMFFQVNVYRSCQLAHLQVDTTKAQNRWPPHPRYVPTTIWRVIRLHVEHVGGK